MLPSLSRSYRFSGIWTVRKPGDSGEEEVAEAGGGKEAVITRTRNILGEIRNDGLNVWVIATAREDLLVYFSFRKILYILLMGLAFRRRGYGAGGGI